MVSTLGGDAQLIAVDGRNPQFSPDGQHIAYWIGVAGDYFVGKMYIAAAAGGTPQQLRSDFSYATHPIWHPDGEVLLFRGNQTSSQSAWWVTPLDGGPAVDIRMFRCSGLAAPELIDFWIPSGWTPDGNHILFSARLGDSTNIWRLPISTESWQVSCNAERLTSGIGEFQPSMAADGRLVFASVVRNVDVWSLPVDADSATVTGEIEQVTRDGAMDSTASVSADGKIISFASNRSGHFDVWIKNLETGKLAALGTSIRSAASFPVLSADGSRLAYTMFGSNKYPVYSVATGGGLPQKICDDCGAPRDWSSDGKRILYQRYAPGGLAQGSTIGVLNAETGEDAELLRSAERKLFHANFSSDDSWITLHGRLGPERTRLLVIPLRGGEPAPEDQWIKVTNREGRDDKPCWSPNGSVLYFISERDGYRCIWARRLNPKTKQPVGESFAIHHFHHARLSMMNLRTTQFDLAAARDKLVFTLSEASGNIWLREPPGR